MGHSLVLSVHPHSAWTTAQWHGGLEVEPGWALPHGAVVLALSHLEFLRTLLEFHSFSIAYQLFLQPPTPPVEWSCCPTVYPD